jgi:hypothetical protein
MTVKCHCDADVGSVVEYKTTCRRQSANLVRFFDRYGHPQGVPNFGLGLLRQLAHLIHRAVASGAFRVAGARDRASVSTRVEQDCLVGV